MRKKSSLPMTAFIASICIFCIFFNIAIAFAQDTAPKKHIAPLPTVDDINASMKRTLGYDPAITWQILDIRESEIPGLVDAVVDINKNGPQHIYFSPDTQLAIIGSIIPFGENPFAPIRSKLQAADCPSRGGQNPIIQIVMFNDLESPSCKVAYSVIEKLTIDFPQVRFTFQHYPLPASMHPWAMKAALYADCAGQLNKEAFWSYISSIFDNQDKMTAANADRKLRDLAVSASLDAQTVAACAAQPNTAARVEKSLKLGQSLQVTSMPTFFINGRRVLSIEKIPYESLKMLVQFEIDHAGN